MPRELPLLLLALVCLAVQLAQYGVRRQLERRPPHRYLVELPASDWPYDPGSGRHRLGDPDAWVACHTPDCAHLTRRHTRTPDGLVCDVCGTTNTGEPMDHDYSEYADAVEQPTREEEKAAEIALDVADEERRAAEEAAAGESAGPEDEDCGAEFIDGSWTYCGCEDCTERETREESEG
ncbi:hypothetical protein [Streptomyces erythrochromogenes]|uniref:hypothetical protein n=1 Tax=Streptomyces erythrochromogenes TaxID=285574 RepID=UPI0036C798C6